MPALSPIPKLQFFSDAGTPLVGGKLYTYAAGTSTPLATKDEAGANNTNPVALDSRGEASVRLQDGLSYKFILKDSADATIWTIDNISEISGQLSASSGSSSVGFIQAGTGAVARTAQTKLRETISLTDFGTDADALTNALVAADGRKLFIPAGTYTLTFSGLTGWTPPAGIEIEGEGKDITILNITPPNSASYPKAFALSAGNIKFKGMTINFLTPSGGTGILLSVSSSDLRFEDVKFDGTCTNTGASISHENHCIGVASSGTSNDVEFINCDFTRWRYTILKANASTCTNRRWSFLHCDSYGSYNEDFSFNSPNGVWDDIQIYMCRFRDTAGASASLNPLYIAFASCTNFRVGACNFSGDVGASGHAIHIEENSIGGTITGNTINVDGYGIELNGNNIGGSITNPSHVVISGNTIRKDGTQKEAGFRGIALVFNASLHNPAQDITIADNSIIGYEDGIFSVTTVDDAVIVHDNYIESCTNGINFSSGSPTIYNNTTANCDVGIISKANTGTAFDYSAVRSHTFINCTLNVDAIELPITLLDPVFIFTEFDHAGGSTSLYKTIAPATANDRAHGYMEIVVMSDSVNDHSMTRDEVTWDGTTFTRSQKIALQPGTINAQAARDSSQLTAQVFGGSTAETNLRLQVRFNGMIVVGV